MIFSYVDPVICSYRHIGSGACTLPERAHRIEETHRPSLLLCAATLFLLGRQTQDINGHTEIQTHKLQTYKPTRPNKQQTNASVFVMENLLWLLVSHLDLTQNVLEPLSRSWRHPGRCTFAERMIPKRICHIPPTWISLGKRSRHQTWRAPSDISTISCSPSKRLRTSHKNEELFFL